MRKEFSLFVCLCLDWYQVNRELSGSKAFKLALFTAVRLTSDRENALTVVKTILSDAQEMGRMACWLHSQPSSRSFNDPLIAVMLV